MDFLISQAHAQGGQPSGGGIELLIMVVVFFVIFYFLIIRPQTKRAKEHRAMVEALSRGDEVVSNGGLMGKIVEVGDSIIRVEIAEGTVVAMQKQAVGTILPKGTLKGD